MSKLVEILEIFNEIEFTFGCIKICETTMADAKRAMEKDSNSNDLKAIYESARADKERAEAKLKGLKEILNTSFPSSFAINSLPTILSAFPT